MQFHSWIIWGVLTSTTFFTIPPAPSTDNPDGAGEAVALDTTPERKAALDTIAYGEGTYKADGYKTLFGGQVIDTDKHPEKCIPFGRTCSTAFGRYQFLDTTWQKIRTKYNLGESFTPEVQDKAAIAVIVEQAGKPVLDKVDRKDPTWIYDVAPIWASFPRHAGDNRGVYGQITAGSKKDLENFYQQRLKHYGIK